jgi:hypothetical protein
MMAVRSTPRRGLLVIIALLGLLPSGGVPAQEVDPPHPSATWLDVDSRPLPYQDRASIERALATAKVVGREAIGRGVTAPVRLVLEHGGRRFHAAWRTVDSIERKRIDGAGFGRVVKYRDAAIFEAAAYALSERLGIGRVPPAVVRRIDGVDGTVQIWVEGAVAEVDLLRAGSLAPPSVARWNQHKQVMFLFDNLIGNRDRNQGNILVDRQWNLWLIDHTRAFSASSGLHYRDELTRCERRLWDTLRSLSNDALRTPLEAFLTRREVEGVIERRRLLIEHIERLIDTRGSASVLFDMLPQPPAAAPPAGTLGGDSPDG